VVNDDEFGLCQVLRDLTYLAGFDSYGILRRVEITTEIPGQMGCFMTTKETHKGIDKTSVMPSTKVDHVQSDLDQPR